MSEVSLDWAQQLAIYGWLLGSAPGVPVVGAIDQISHRNGVLTVSRYRNRIFTMFQNNLLWGVAQLQKAWETEHFFQDLPVAESREKQEAIRSMFQDYGDLLNLLHT